MEWTWKALVLLIGSLLAAAPAPTTPAGTLRRDMLAAHNAVRARVGVPPLTWSSQLEAVAREWAQSLLASGTFSHRPNPTYGENLFEIRGGTASPALVVGDWAGEAKNYNWARNSCRTGAMCGHYTQLVWRATLRVGCAAGRRGGREVWVCNYDPPGNWVGEKPY